MQIMRPRNFFRPCKVLLGAMTLCLQVSSSFLHAQVITAYGIKVNVTDIRKALVFYHDILGFNLVPGGSDSNTVALSPGTGTGTLLLKKVSYLLPKADNEAGATLTLQVNNLDSTIASLTNKGITFKDYVKRKEGVGYAIYIDDPFETRLSLMQETVVYNAHFQEPRIYNYGFYVPDMQAAIEFYAGRLGFARRSEKYLPLDLPLGHTDGSFAFMIHYRDKIEPIHYNSADNEHIVVLFQCKSLDRLTDFLKEKNIKFIDDKTGIRSGLRLISFYDPFGYLSQITEIK
jgi:catechol 2,3-dioxygenase-like lactoylglutathione lyase family enzyme